MKPSDHPDFFRLPPPPGRSRESQIVLDEEGRFWNGPVPVDHAGMAAAFASWIRRHPDDGRYILTNGYDWTYFTVKSTPFFVRHVDIHADGEGKRRASVLLFDGTEEPLDPGGIHVDEQGVLYASVKCGEYEARFLHHAQREMVDLVEERSDGTPCITIDGISHPIQPRDSQSVKAPADSSRS